MNLKTCFFNSISLVLVAALTLGAGLILPDSSLAGPPVRNKAHMSVHGRGGKPPGGGGGKPGGKRPGGKNTNINVNVHHHGRPKPPPPPPPRHRHYYHGGSFAAGVVTGFAVGAIVTAASMPPATSCTDVIIGGVVYRQCGTTWFQPRYHGTTVQYIVVNPPR